MNSSTTPTQYRFSFGPWNISTGADPFGPPVRKEMEYARKLKAYKELGFDAVQFHDDDIVPADLDWASTKKGIADVKKILDGEGLFVEIVAPRLWEDPRTIDGAFTSNNPDDRKYAIDRSRRCVDIAREIGCKNYVLWLAREGSYIREAKCAKTAIARIVDAWNAILEHDKDIRVLGEAKPNEPMDQAYLPTVGHMIGVAYKTVDPSPFRRLDRKRPLDSGRPRPGRRHGLCPLSQQALERAPERPERPEIRPGQGFRLGRPPPRVQPDLGAREKRLRPERRVRGARRQGDAHHHIRRVDIPPRALEDHVPPPARRGSRRRPEEGRGVPVTPSI